MSTQANSIDVRVDREKYIGGSDVPIIMGISPFTTYEELVTQKATATLPPQNLHTKKYADFGNVMEGPIREFINKKYNLNFIEGSFIVKKYRANVDGYDQGKNVLLEIKTWPEKVEEQNKKYPLYYYQMQLYLHVLNELCGTTKCLLATYNRPKNMNTEFDESRINIQQITYDPELFKKIDERVSKFWSDVSVIQLGGDLNDLKDNELIKLSNAVELLEEELASYDLAKKRHEALREQMCDAMNSSGIKTFESLSLTKYTLIHGKEAVDKEVEISNFDVDQFALENPDLYDKYLKTEIIVKKGRATKQSLRITKKKEGKN